MKNILITGGAGFIGSNLALALIKKNYTVTVLDTLSPQIHGADDGAHSSLYQQIKGRVKFIKGSVTEKDKLEAALEGQDAVVHYAAETGTGQSMYDIHNYVNVNVGGTALMLDILANNRDSYQVKKVVVASSRSIYGEGKYLSANGPVYPVQRSPEEMDRGNFEVTYQGVTEKLQLVATDEDSKIHPSSVYGITKQNQEQMIMTVCPTIGINAVALRYQNVYGPGQSLTNPYTGILSIFSTLIRNGRDINIFEDGLESRDFVYIDDVVNATIAALENDAANNDVFNVGSGVATDVLTVAQTLIELYNSASKLNVSGNYRLGDIRHNYADLQKISSKIGFTPETNFREGITKFVEWVKGQDVVESKYDTSLQEMRAKGLFK